MFKEPSWILLFYVGLFCSSTSFADFYNKPTSEKEESTRAILAGIWHSPEWGYGFRIEGDKGYVTSWNNNYNPDDPTTTGDVVLRITEFLKDGFKAVHTFYDGSQIEVVARVVDENTIELSGRREIWKMYRRFSE